MFNINGDTKVVTDFGNKISNSHFSVVCVENVACVTSHFNVICILRANTNFVAMSVILNFEILPRIQINIFCYFD